MSAFVFGLLVLQALLGVYQLSCVSHGFNSTDDLGATRLPAPAVFLHMVDAVAGVLVWILWMNTGFHGFAWAGFIIFAFDLLVGGSLGARTFGKPGYVSVPSGADGAAVQVGVAEQTIPTAVLVLHGVSAVAIVVLSLGVALSWF